MKNSLPDLMVAVVSYVTEHGGYVTKTKLLKLLYLFDVEFYRVHGRIFTELQWKYFHLGPWTKEFDPLLESLVSKGCLTENVSGRSEFDTKFLRASEPVELKRPFNTYKDEAILKTLLDTWGPSTTGEILDFVYFRTEPMEHGVRNEPLDFSKVIPQRAGIYRRAQSGKTPREINALRKQFAQKTAVKLSPSSFQFTPPRYDDEFEAAMEKLDAGEV